MSDLLTSDRNRMIAVVIVIIVFVLVIGVLYTNYNSNGEPEDETGTELTTEEVDNTTPEVMVTEAGD